MDSGRHEAPHGATPAKVSSGGSLRMLKWLVIAVLVVLVLLALLLPDKGLAWLVG